MNNKLITSNQFFNNWARKNRDPDGNCIHTYVSGGSDGTYQNWIRSKQIETKSLNITPKYKWVSENTNCFNCKSLDGKIFDYKPNVEEVAHPNCKCKVVEVSEEEAAEIEREREEEIGRRDEVVEYATDKAKYINKDGKLIYPDGRPAEYGECAKYVGNALEKTFPDYDRPAEAKNAGKSLEKVGFIKIPAGMNYEPIKGDIAVFNGLNEKHAGHIQIYNEKNWVSDFKQVNDSDVENMGTGFWAGPDYRKVKPDYEIYRNPRWQK